MRYSAEQVESARRSWREFCAGLDPAADVDAVLDDAVRYLDSGLDSNTVATILRLRAGRPAPKDAYEQWLELWYLTRARADLRRMAAEGRLAPGAQAAVDQELATRLAILNQAGDPLPLRVEASAEPVPAPRPAEPVPAAPAAAPAPAPPPPGVSLRELVTDHSVVILASLGAFLLVVATVLFELYASTGLDARLLAVVGLDAVFATAGYLAIGRERLRAVGQIYIALAAVLLPLVAVAAWSLLDLRGHGITVDQALAVTGAACAAVYGLLALRLGLLAYADLAGAAMVVAMWGAAGALAGPEWRSAPLAATPFVLGALRRAARSREFRHFEWFGHASAVVALVTLLAAAGAGSPVPQWMPTVTFAVLSTAYLAWQALEPRRLHAWPGEALAVIASLLLVVSWGAVSYRYLLPFALGAALVLLRRRERWFGVAGRLYRPHAGHLHLAVATGLVASAVNTPENLAWHVVAGLWVAAALYAADYSLQPNAGSGYLVRVALPFALLATAEAAHLHAWSGAVVAASLVAYAAPMAPRLWAPLLARRAPVYLYGVLPLVAIELREATVAPGQWAAPAALAVAGGGLALAAELGGARMAGRMVGLSARVLIAGAWFLAVEALDLAAWRGPADALLALSYTAIGQLRQAAGHRAAVEARRPLVHVTSAAAIALCFAGPPDRLWWRLAAALAIVAVGYWWQAVTRPDAEAAPIAWAAVAGSAAALVLAAVPHDLQGPAVAIAATALTVAWWPVRRRLGPGRLAAAAFPVLAATAALGAILALRQEPPTWPQAATALVLAGFLLAWWRMRVEVPAVQPVLRPTSALFAFGASLLAAGVLQLNVPVTGLAIVVLVAGHAAWAVRGEQGLERGYALGVALAAPVVLFDWPFRDPLPGLVAAELLAVATLIALVGIRRRLPQVAGAVVIAAVPAVHFLVVAAGLTRAPAPEETAMLALAWAAGVAGLVLRSRFAPAWAWSVELAAGGIAAIAVAAAYSTGDADVAGAALLAYSPVVFTAGVQERRWPYIPGAVAAGLVGVFTLLVDRRADTLLYPAALGVVGLATWVVARVLAPRTGAAHRFIDVSRWLGIALLVTAGLSGFAFPDRTGTGSIGAALATLAFLATAGVLVLDARFFALPQNLYAGLLVGSVAGFFAARGAGVHEWELCLPGLGLVACAVLLRQESWFHVPQPARQAGVALGALLAMGWAIALTLAGDAAWMVALLVEGALAVAAGIVLRSRVLLACGGAAVALVSLRALFAIAQAGYLFVAFGLVALVLLVAASALALGRDRLGAAARGRREQLADWD